MKIVFYAYAVLGMTLPLYKYEKSIKILNSAWASEKSRVWNQYYNTELNQGFSSYDDAQKTGTIEAFPVFHFDKNKIDKYSFGMNVGKFLIQSNRTYTGFVLKNGQAIAIIRAVKGPSNIIHTGLESGSETYDVYKLHRNNFFFWTDTNQLAYVDDKNNKFYIYLESGTPHWILFEEYINNYANGLDFFKKHIKK